MRTLCVFVPFLFPSGCAPLRIMLCTTRNEMEETKRKKKIAEMNVNTYYGYFSIATATAEKQNT